jgi:phospholipid/cholesterol/gamma-HCH transport system ATP-binding protein
MGEPIIQLVDLYKSFGDNRVLQGVNLEIERGETMVIIGGSGTGKSVILKHIIGLMKPDRGRVIVDGKDLSTLKERSVDELRKKFGMLFQYAALFDSLTVWENVGFALRQQTHLSDEEIKHRATEKLSTVGLRGVEDRMPADLSGGMKKRVGLARALAMEPEILLYDEPTTGLDPIMADAINELILEMKRRLQVTGVAITHDMTSAYKIADRIAMLYQGKIQAVGSPDAVKNSKDPIVHQFVTGSSVGPIKTV